MMDHAVNQVVFTDDAHCRDCYRCLRACPVKAIRMVNGQARVDPDRCIACGTCIRECPQGAKRYRRDLPRARALLRSGRPVACSLAPSFVGAFTPELHRRLPSALRRLGFAHVAETAVGAYAVARRVGEIVRDRPDETHLCTACPVVVTYVQRYWPELTDSLTPVPSPMAAHAADLMNRLGPKVAVVFIGPCVGKKDEVDRLGGAVACALTFEELIEWFEADDVELAALEESDFDETPGQGARFFPVSGGLARTACLETDLLSDEVLSPSGIDELDDVFAAVGQGERVRLVDPLFCRQGCINGPAMPRAQSVFTRRRHVLAHATEPVFRQADAVATPAVTRFAPRPVNEKEFTEDEIRRVLRQTGKATPADELDCGACGYASCRDKAVAVLRGMAEPEMCIPYMRRLAEQRSDRIIETSPNGIVILDGQLRILSMNPAFRRLFTCGEELIGKRISRLFDPDAFERLAAGGPRLVERTVRHEKYGLLCRELCYRLPDEDQFVGLFVNVTQAQATRRQFDALRAQIIDRARELMDHQVKLAQNVAALLGESTVRGEELLDSLLQMPEANGPEVTPAVEKGLQIGEKGIKGLGDSCSGKQPDPVLHPPIP